MTRTQAKRDLLASLGAQPVVADALDADALDADALDADSWGTSPLVRPPGAALA